MKPWLVVSVMAVIVIGAAGTWWVMGSKRTESPVSAGNSLSPVMAAQHANDGTAQQASDATAQQTSEAAARQTIVAALDAWKRGERPGIRSCTE
jgi:hypothetical protein